MINQLEIIKAITSLFPLDTQIEHIKSHTDRAGGNVLPAMDNEGKLCHYKLKKPIVPLNLNFVPEKNLSYNWETRVVSYSEVMKHFEEDVPLNFFIEPGLSSLALGLFYAADLENNSSMNIYLPPNIDNLDEDTIGFITYNLEKDTLYFVIEYSFN